MHPMIVLVAAVGFDGGIRYLFGGRRAVWCLIRVFMPLGFFSSVCSYYFRMCLSFLKTIGSARPIL